MSNNPYEMDKEQRDVFFREISRLVRKKLPAGIRDFTDSTEPGKNWMRLRYPSRLPNVSYELQFATNKSIQHEQCFGKGNKVVLAL